MTIHSPYEALAKGPQLSATFLSTDWRRVRWSGSDGQHDRTIPRAFLEAMRERLDRSQATPLQHQISRLLSDGIIEGAIEAGSRLPSTRGLAVFLGVSRNTVIAAYDLLIAEGLLESLHGSGTFVAEDDDRTRGARSQPASRPPRASAEGARDKGTTVLGRRMSTDMRARTFRPELPAIDQFPIALWTKMLTRAVNSLAMDSQRFLLAECDSQGCLPLREVLASQFSAVRGVHCRPENVIIFAGPQQARDTVLRTLLGAGDPVLIEDPCHPRAVETLHVLGARIVDAPVDSEGMDVEEGLELCPDAKVAYISPRIQFPFGYRLSDTRRRRLERWACDTSAWIVEDDYSSDSTIFDQRDQPLPLDSGTNRTVLLGAFNKILFPSLRVALAIVPDALLPQLLKVRRLAGGYAPLAEQLVLEEFIRDGHLDRHIRRSSKLSRQRLSFMTEIMEHHLDGLVEPAFVNSGTHLVGWLPQHEEVPVVERGAAYGLELMPLSRFSVSRRQRPGLLLGYGGFSECEIETGITNLRRSFG